MSNNIRSIHTCPKCGHEHKCAVSRGNLICSCCGHIFAVENDNNTLPAEVQDQINSAAELYGNCTSYQAGAEEWATKWWTVYQENGNLCMTNAEFELEVNQLKLENEKLKEEVSVYKKEEKAYVSRHQALKEKAEKMTNALQAIEQMSDPGSYERAITDMKWVATRALSAWKAGEKEVPLFNRDENSLQGNAAIGFFVWMQKTSVSHADIPLPIKYRMYIDQLNVKGLTGKKEVDNG